MGAVGQNRLQINEPCTARTLKNQPGNWSNLALALLIHVGMQPKARAAVAADTR